jgi:hypothetical protein
LFEMESVVTEFTPRGLSERKEVFRARIFGTGVFGAGSLGTEVCRMGFFGTKVTGTEVFGTRL